MTQMKKFLLSAAALGFALSATAQTMPSAPATAMPHHPDMAKMHQAMCGEMPAHAAAKLAYLEAKLELTDAQKPLFAKWRQSLLDSANKNKATCLANAPKEGAMPNALEREAHMEAMLEAHLQAMKAARPSLEALYNSLTAAQKQTFDHAHHGGMGHQGMMGHGGGMGGHMFMGHGSHGDSDGMPAH
jgi:hypothetical protein